MMLKGCKAVRADTYKKSMDEIEAKFTRVQKCAETGDSALSNSSDRMRAKSSA